MSAKIAPLEDVRTIELREKRAKKGGLGWTVTGLFIVGELAGAGIVALPTALLQADFFAGLALVVITGAAVTYTAHVLGRSWVVLQKRWPQYREHCRKPYAEIGNRALGPGARKVVSVTIDITQFGAAVVLLLLSSKNFRDFLDAVFGVKVSLCWIMLVVAVFLLPLTLLKSPQDFWWAAVFASISTTCAVILLMVGSIMDFGVCYPERGTNGKFVATNYLLSLGTILFSYGGHSAFPTVQHDMRKPQQFTRSAALAFTLISLLYAPVSILGYLTYGNSLRDSIINSIQTVPIQQTVNLLIAIHCLLTLTIIFNPLNQELEDLFSIPHEWCWKRGALRTSVMVLVVFVAESIPSFGPLLDLVGSSTLTLTSVVYPCLFYLFIAVAEEKCLEKGTDSIDEPATLSEVFKRSPRTRLIICSAIIVFGLVGGAAASYSAVMEIASARFTPPCYVIPFLKSTSSEFTVSSLNCCGRYQNVTRDGVTQQCNPFEDFYKQ